MNKKMKIGLSLLVGIFIVAGSLATWSYFSNQSVALENSNRTSGINGYQGKDWALSNLEGEVIRLSDYKSQPVLLVFWATWCPYCKKLLPGIQRLHEKYQDKGLKIIAVNIKEDWKPHVYWRNHEYTFDTVLEGDDVAKIYGISGTPGLVFIDPDGKVLSTQSFSDPENPVLEKFAEAYTNSEAMKNN